MFLKSQSKFIGTWQVCDFLVWELRCVSLVLLLLIMSFGGQSTKLPKVDYNVYLQKVVFNKDRKKATCIEEPINIWDMHWVKLTTFKHSFGIVSVIGSISEPNNPTY